MTVQDRPHLGHMRAALSGEILRRYLRHLGYEVTYVTNFTDIDDKIIAKAEEQNEDWRDIAERHIQAYLDFAEVLGIEPADHFPRATRHIQEIVDLIQKLVDAGKAYEAGGDVYFSVKSDPAYGAVSGRRTEELQVGARIEPGEAKRDPLDFTLWKGAKPGEPSWESPWGPGRPGWHIECSAMSMKYLGQTLDFHGGGLDLVFPHHENERAQSECATGHPFVRHWVHNGLVTMGGEKMSKSSGHYYPMEQAVEDFQPEVVRFYLLSTHYRSPIEFSKERLSEAAAAYERIETMVRAARRAIAAGGAGEAGGSEKSAGAAERLAAGLERAEDGFHAAMRDDLNTAAALGKVFDLVKAANVYLEEAPTPDPEALSAGLEALSRMGTILGLFGREGFGREEEIPAEASALAAERAEARRAKDWARADEIRDRLLEMGYTVEDRPEGPLVRRAAAGTP
jgi:cysteinyl-tRNA synthetase